MHLIITISIFCIGLLWYSKMFYLISTTDNSFNVIIENKWQLFVYFSYTLSIFFLATYIILIGLSNVNRVININEILTKIIDTLEYLPWIILLWLFVIILCLIVFWVLLIKLLYQYLKSALLTLFLYSYQYNFISELCSSYIDFRAHRHLYLVRRVAIFTENEPIIGFSSFLWPSLWYIFEPKIFTFILPYLCIFDYCCHQGNISKLFIVLPWYYIYMLLRSLGNLFLEFFTEDNIDFATGVYKHTVINGKVHRWVEKPE